MCDTRSMPVGAGRNRSRAFRRDAIENRERILRTAAQLMARRGHNVPLTEIADAAGVGVGTFYRGFPDRAACSMNCSAAVTSCARRSWLESEPMGSRVSTQSRPT